jgi:hypothetical protein
LSRADGNPACITTGRTIARITALGATRH